MEKSKTFVLLLFVGMLIVSCCQISKPAVLSPISENEGDKMLSLEFGSNTQKILSTTFGSIVMHTSMILKVIQF